ncbi:RHS repeat-associated core domain-containing protein [Pseudoalteromonas rubra]|uniref:RHS repeat-associated core domain-containing protein n=1 Tax=Pseudoalteromonas rubra TaxID=43658 RepID=UPI0013DE22EF|nr:RHS repeat-associated core domain-containing protein [Pseudoalteromonas rubra]
MKFKYLLVLMLLTFSCFVKATVDKSYFTYKDKSGAIYVESPKQFVLIAVDQVSIPLLIYPSNGLIKIQYINGQWVQSFLNGHEWEALKPSLIKDSSLLSRLKSVNLGANGEEGFILYTDATSYYPATLLSLNKQSGYVNGVEIPTNINLGAYTLKDVNGDGIIDVSFNDEVFLGSADGGYVYTNKQVATPATKVALTTGHFRVDESGQSTYTIPVSLPTGPGGIKPSVAISYSSGSGPGNAGYGWYVSAGSSITRCSKNIATDGEQSAVRLSRNDGYCLDGQRLLLVSGTYGAANSTYRTELASFSKITAVGKDSINTGPSSFIVETKDGDVKYYGLSSDSNVKPATPSDNRKTTHTWALSKVEDVYNNTIQFQYDKSEHLGTHRLTSILYGQVRVAFNYAMRNTRHSGYLLGGKTHSTRRITSITVTKSGEAYRHYAINSDGSKHDYIDSIQECISSGGSCKPATQFEYNKSLDETKFTFSGFQESGLRTTTLFGDFNGDGKADKVFTDKTGKQLTVAITEGITDTVTRNLKSASAFQLADVNGDGYTDIIYAENSIWYARAFQPGTVNRSKYICEDEFLNNEDDSFCRVVDYVEERSFSNAQNLGISYGAQPAMLADVNGDGLVDWLHATGKSLGYRANIASKDTLGRKYDSNIKYFYTFTDRDFGPARTGCSISRQIETKFTKTGDLNGDGISDFVVKLKSAYRPSSRYARCSNTADVFTYKVLISKQTANYDAHPIDLESDTDLRFAALNQDGYADLVYTKKGIWYSRVSTGSTTSPFLPERRLPNIDEKLGSDAYKGNVHFADINNDQLSDIVALQPIRTIVRYGECRNENGDPRERPAPGEPQLETRQQCPPGEYWVPAKYGDGLQTVYWLGKSIGAASAVYEYHKVGSALPTTNYTLKLADVNGDGLPDMLRSNSTPVADATWNQILNDTKSAQGAEHRLVSITNGFGVKTSIDYKNIKDRSVYTYIPALNTLGKVNASFFSPKHGVWVVNEVNSDSNTLAGFNERVGVRYEYAGLVINKRGRGTQGFHQISTTDKHSGVKTSTYYHQNWPYTGRPARTVTYTSDDLLIAEAKSTWSTSRSHLGETFVYLRQASERGWQIGTDNERREIKRVLTVNSYDEGMSEKWGNLTKTVVKTFAADNTALIFADHTTTNINTYHTENDGLRFGRLKKATVTQEMKNGYRKATRQTEFEYYPNLMLKSETVAGECASESVTRPATGYCDRYNTHTKSYEYDAFGNVNKTTVSGYHGSRTSTKQYDSTGELVIQKTNVQGHKTSYLYNGTRSAKGIIHSSSVTDPNGLTSTSFFDAWGDPVKTIHADGNESRQSTQLCGSNKLCAGVNGYYFTQSVEPGSSPVYTVYDKFGRQTRSIKYLLDGTQSYEDITYDKHNNPQSKTLPYRPGERPESFQYRYDKYNRLTTSTKPGGKSTSINYYGNDTVTSDNSSANDGVAVRGYYRRERVDILGRTVFKTEPYVFGADYKKVSKVVFEYDAFGNQVTARNEIYDVNTSTFKSSEIHTEYDNYGRKLKVKDPSRGEWKTFYSTFGEIKSVITSRSSAGDVYEKLEHHYDRWGRIQRTVQVEKQTSKQLIQCYVYGESSSARNLGKLIATHQYRVGKPKPSRPNARPPIWSCDLLASRATPSLSKFYYFDGFGRPSKQVTSNEGGEFAIVNGYNSVGQLTDRALPNGLFVKTLYRHGYAYKTINAQTNTLLSEIKEVDAQGRVTEQLLAGGVTRAQAFESDSGFIDSITISNGRQTLYNVTYKHDARGTTRSRESTYYEPGYGSDWFKYAETFEYEDNGLQRLESRTVTHSSSNYATPLRLANESYSYDGFGNLKSHSNVGTYHYNNKSNPYQLSSISGKAGKRSYSMQYDEHGNIVNDGQRKFFYTHFDKPYKILKNSSTYTEFKYDEKQTRYYRKDVRSINGNIQTKETYYIGKIYELTKRAGGKDGYGKALPDQIEHRWYVAGVVISEIEGQGLKTEVAHTDMLGSTVMVTNGSGNAIAQYLYDPWGKQQQVYASSGLSLSLMPLSQMRGFTGHEQIDDLEIVHMNGRIYDANIGRFLQADPFVQFPGVTQSHNRYSYVLNNPLTYNDPSGYFLKKLMEVTGISSILKAIAKVPILDAAVSIGLTFVAPWSVGIYQALKTYAVTGSFGAALRGFVISNLTIAASSVIGSHLPFDGWYAVANVASHAAVGGIASVLQGGEFGHGFVSSMVTASMKGFMNPQTGTTADAVRRTVIAGLVGGTVSEVTGGKFANGAVTSAMQWWFNAENGGKFAEKDDQALTAMQDEVSNAKELNKKGSTRDEARMRLATLEEMLAERDFSGKELDSIMKLDRATVNYRLQKVSQSISSGGLNNLALSTGEITLSYYEGGLDLAKGNFRGAVQSYAEMFWGVIGAVDIDSNNGAFMESYNQALTSNVGDLLEYRLNSALK